MLTLQWQGQPIRIHGEWNKTLFEHNKWLEYLCKTHENSINVERVKAVRDITGYETLQYVFRTLSILEQKKEELTEREYRLVKATLCWSEVAKGGLFRVRKEWSGKGYPLAIHNLASAEIFLDEMESSKEYSEEEKNIIYTLIKTHGVLGQNIRGEVSVSKNEPLLSLRETLGEEELKKVLLCLNSCVIGAVSTELWEKVSEKAQLLIEDIAKGRLTEYPGRERISWLCHALSNVSDADLSFFEKEIFAKYELWYFDSALFDFQAEQIIQIMKKILPEPGMEEVEHITFKPLADSLFYDYEGRKHINVYKKRVIEKYLRDGEATDVRLKVTIENKTASVDICFSVVCEKMLEFCVEAERSGMLTYEKSITVLFDLFGFRRDEFDRLNNEDKYLQTMNDSSDSTKASIADYVVGKRLVDVGSGGGVMLDLLEEKYPDKTVIGTDISTNVIETLLEKKEKEGHGWEVVKHNFVEGAFEGEKVDSILFSSILHEVFSYTETEKGRFQIETVYQAIKYAFDSLNPGGRIIIRDGIKTSYHGGKDKGLLKVTFASREGLDFFENYAKDFKGLPDVTENRPTLLDEDTLSVVGDVNFMREFLYTYTWGNESYSHEVQEQFGYLTLEEYKELFEKLGAELVEAREFLEPGYEAHLGKLVSLSNPFTGQSVAFPNSNCIIVAKKRGELS